MGFLEDQITAAKAKEKEAKAKAAAKRRADIARARQLAKKMESDIAVRIAAKLREHDEGLYLHLRAQVESALCVERDPAMPKPETAPVTSQPASDSQGDVALVMREWSYDGGGDHEHGE